MKGIVTWMLYHLDWLIEYWLIFKVDHLSNSPYQGSADKHLLGIYLKSLGPIDRKFRGHGKNDGFALYEYIIKQCSSFCKYTNISDVKKMSNKITCQQ